MPIELQWPNDGALDVARAVVDYRGIEAERRRIAFARPGMGITLNSVAQSILPNWVRGRGLAVYLTVFNGAMAAGSLGWGLVAQQIGADFVTRDYRELLKRPEVTAVLISTVGHLHADPTLVALENPNKPALLIEKPISNQLAESEKVLSLIQQAGVDALIGYTQRFRRRWQVAKDKIANGALGDVTTVSSRPSRATAHWPMGNV